MNGQVLIWDISEYTSKLEAHISIWDHEVIMEKQTDKLHIQDGFIPVLHWSAESNLKESHKAQIQDLHWLPSNVWVIFSQLKYLLINSSICLNPSSKHIRTLNSHLLIYSSVMKVRTQNKTRTP